MSISREMLVALSIGAFIISGSLYVSASNTTVQGEVTASAQTAPERQYIEPKDSDGDGISDWAEQLLSDREAIAAELNPDEPYALPETLTGQFSIRFFQDYLMAKGMGTYELEGSREELIKKAADSLKKEATDYIYTVADIEITEGNSIQELHAYGNQVAAIVIENSANVELDEMSIFERALEQDNPDRLTQMDPIIEVYEQYLELTLATPVPTDLVQDHLNLINVYNAILHDLQAMRNVYDDPLLGLLRTKRYNQDVEGMVYTYFSLDRALRRAGVTYEDDEPGIVFDELAMIKQLIDAR